MRVAPQRGTLIAMTTTDPTGGYLPPPAPPAAPHRVLRRSRTDRVGAGVAGGLGEYFGLDPVLFRVLFATAAFFGGAGLLAYVVAWAAIPEQGTVHAPIDGVVGSLRRHRVPVWLVAIIAALALWGIAFSWWAPGHFFPVILITIILVAFHSRRGHSDKRDAGTPPASDPAAPSDAPTVNLAKEGAPAAPDGSPTWMSETRQWFTEAKEASRLRRRRAMPIRVATFGTLIATLVTLALLDAATGIAIPVYFWAILGIVGVGLLVGMVLRRTPWTAALLLGPACVGLVAFGGSHARLHDGFGAREWTPTNSSALESHYRLAFGKATLDLRHLDTLESSRTIEVVLGAGEAELLLPSTMNATVNANVHIGEIGLDGAELDADHNGFNLNRTIFPPAGVSGPELTIDVHVTDGRIQVDRGD
jgi:phage shock protein PspC (stress-responsive transcriptional regulator)